MSIIVKEVTKIYGKQKALDNVSFEVGKGEVVGFLGPNGAGKSTMMKIITCYIPPTSGDVSVCGLDIWNDSLELRAKVGYLSEANPLYYDMYVKEFLLFIAGIHKIKDKQSAMERVIKQTGLSLEQHKKIGALSRGYKQRVGLAQALIHDPEVLILDEPTTGLDPNQLVDIRELIKECGKSKTVLLSTHIMQEVEAVCDRVIIINRGNIVADAKIKDLPEMAAKMGVKIGEEKREIIGMEELFHALTKK
ncbi:ATP-binding cassette domain-containing protein [Bacteroidales bacterium OttesenSCG-928-B11]|nr:ATP-binding cassette domain-containing protein [Bacteroidales bacterium OttesenSCG-928-C03]MDL2311819.1 ATP-binding cassette domain-containing protein [Bacteroidales bacterium OttesenSCG-928-B11]MDL2325532.1 ATP-binding cassette domain-containing protein [Bacteroidales bacterium OttesenSCG-928-A14]